MFTVFQIPTPQFQRIIGIVAWSLIPICLFFLLSGCNESHKIPDCGTINFPQEELPDRMQLFYPLTDSLTRLCEYDYGDVHLYHSHIPNMEAAKVLLDRYEQALEEAGYTPDLRKEVVAYPWDPGKDYLKDEFTADFGVLLEYAKGEEILSIEYSFLGIFHELAYMEVTIHDRTPDVTEEQWIARLETALPALQELKDLVPPRGQSNCDQEKVSSINESWVNLIDYSKLREYVEIDPQSTLQRKPYIPLEEGEVYLKTIAEIETELTAGGGRYFLIKQIFRSGEPNLHLLGFSGREGSFLPGFESGVIHFIDLEQKEVLCSQPYFAENSEYVSYDEENPIEVLSEDLDSKIRVSISNAIREMGATFRFD